jgi:hypothetical protein
VAEDGLQGERKALGDGVAIGFHYYNDHGDYKNYRLLWLLLTTMEKV